MTGEDRWFRPPAFIETGRRGDLRAYFWVAEPAQGKGVYGVYWEVSEELLLVTPFGILERLKEAAKGELYNRISQPDIYAQQEGELLERFRWHPILVRHMNGRTTIRTDHEYVLIEALLDVEKGGSLGGAIQGNFAGLYVRPGRTIFVNGAPPDEVVKGQEGDSTEVGPAS